MNKIKTKLYRRESLISKLINKLKTNFNVLSKIIANKFFYNKNNKQNENKETRNKFGFPIGK